MFAGFDLGRAEQDGELNLSYSSENQSKMNDEKMREVCQALETHPGIKVLMLRSRAVTFSMIEILAKNETLNSLDVSYNKITRRSIQALAGMRNITTLCLEYCRISSVGFQELFSNFRHLTTIDISGNPEFDEKAAEALAASDTVIAARLANNKIENKIAEILATNVTLTTLDLSDNRISAIGVMSLAKNTTIINLNLANNPRLALLADTDAGLAGNNTLRVLNVSSTRMRDIGPLLLARNKKLVSLDLTKNKIGSIGAAALLEELASNIALTHLNVDYKDFKEEEKRGISEKIYCNRQTWIFWTQLPVLISFFKANRNHIFIESILPLLSIITGMIDEARTFEPRSSAIVKLDSGIQKCLSTVFFKSHLRLPPSADDMMTDVENTNDAKSAEKSERSSNASAGEKRKRFSS